MRAGGRSSTLKSLVNAYTRSKVFVLPKIQPLEKERQRGEVAQRELVYTITLGEGNYAASREEKESP